MMESKVVSVSTNSRSFWRRRHSLSFRPRVFTCPDVDPSAVQDESLHVFRFLRQTKMKLCVGSLSASTCGALSVMEAASPRPVFYSAAQVPAESSFDICLVSTRTFFLRVSVCVCLSLHFPCVSSEGQHHSACCTEMQHDILFLQSSVGRRVRVTVHSDNMSWKSFTDRVMKRRCDASIQSHHSVSLWSELWKKKRRRTRCVWVFWGRILF